MKFTKQYNGAKWRGKDVTRNTSALISSIIVAFDLEELSKMPKNTSHGILCAIWDSNGAPPHYEPKYYSLIHSATFYWNKPYFF
jgi:hypothetical protein